MSSRPSTRTPTRRVSRLPLTGSSTRLPPNRANLLAEYRTRIVDGKLICYRPGTASTTQQVKGSGFFGAGSAPASWLTTEHVITATCATGSAPTCAVNGTMTFGADNDCWDVWVKTAAGVVVAFLPGINVSQATELDASGNGNHLAGLVDTVITERLDGSGTNYANEAGFTVADGSQYLDDAAETAVTIGWRIPALINGNGAASWSWENQVLTIDYEGLYIDGEIISIGV